MSSLSIIIPAYNEEARLGLTLEKIAEAWNRKQMRNLELKQIIVANDGSTDRTKEIAESWTPRLPVEVAQLDRNRGKGAAVRAGVQRANAELVLIYDADGAAPILEVNKLCTELQKESADIAIGSRLGTADSLVTMSLLRRLIGRVYHALCASLVPNLKDTACGCKLFKTEIAKKLFKLQRIDRFSFDVEILAIALIKKYRIVEVPLSWTAIPESKVRLVRDGLQMFWCLITLYIRKWTGCLSQEERSEQ